MNCSIRWGKKSTHLFVKIEYSVIFICQVKNHRSFLSYNLIRSSYLSSLLGKKVLLKNIFKYLSSPSVL